MDPCFQRVNRHFLSFEDNDDGTGQTKRTEYYL